MCASGGKSGTCKPRPTMNECPVFDQCPNACGCNGKWFCSACEAHVEGVSVTADNTWCMDGGTVISCGGWSEFECPSGMFCDYPANDPCGGGDSMGVCVPTPMCPDPGGSGACGCDGQYYLSECSAQAAGTDVTGGKECVDGGPPQACGGKAGIPCASDEWCDYAEGNCGAWDNMGICMKKPSGCPEDCPGVCGCDGLFHCNACNAHESGVDDAPGNTSCLPQPDAGSDQYSAQAWSGGLDHILIYKADWTRNVCLTIHLAAPHQPIAGFSTPDGWGLASASISNNAANCAGGTSTGDPVVSTQTVTGSVVFGMGDGGYMPCSLNVHATLVFTSGPSWVYPNELMNADGVVVGGGCW